MKCINRIDDAEIHEELTARNCLWGSLDENGEFIAELILGEEFACDDKENVVRYQWTIEEIVDDFVGSRVNSGQKDDNGEFTPAIGCEPNLSQAIASLEKQVNRLKALRRKAYAVRGNEVKRQ